MTTETKHGATLRGCSNSSLRACLNHNTQQPRFPGGIPKSSARIPNSLETHRGFSLGLITVFMIRTRGSVYVAVILCIHKLDDYSCMSTSHFFLFLMARTWSRSFQSYSSSSAGALLCPTSKKKSCLLEPKHLHSLPSSSNCVTSASSTPDAPNTLDVQKFT